MGLHRLDGLVGEVFGRWPVVLDALEVEDRLLCNPSLLIDNFCEPLVLLLNLLLNFLFDAALALNRCLH